MKKIFYGVFFMSLILIAIPQIYAQNEWRAGSGENTVLGTITVSDIDAKTFQNIVDPLDRLLSRYIRGATVTFNSTTAIDITRGEISCQNSGATITRMRKNTSTTTLTSSNLDVGVSFANSSTYSVYAVCDATATTFTGVISLNSSTPDSGAATYFILLGTFTTDSSGNIIDGSISAPAEDPDVAIATVYDYGTSSSSSTTRTTGVLLAYGRATMSSGIATITNLPFSATPACVPTRQNATDVSQGIQITAVSSTSVTIRDSQGTNNTVHWICVGI